MENYFKKSSIDSAQLSLTPTSPRSISIDLALEGKPPGPGEWNFIVLFNGHIILESKWHSGLDLTVENFHLDLKDPFYQDLIADKPLFFLLRVVTGKFPKDSDPLLHADNRSGGNVDLLPLVLGEENVFTNVRLVLIATGEPIDCNVVVHAKIQGPFEPVTSMPFVLSILSAHCMPYAREGTVYIAALDLDCARENSAVHFGMSVSSETANKLVWATASNGGFAANTAMNVPSRDKYIPQSFDPADNETCNRAYWNAMKRVLVDSSSLKEKLATPLVLEVAGVPRFGKIDVRGRYLAFIDASVLLEPGVYGATICANLYFYTAAMLPANIKPLLEIPPTSAKVSARETDLIMDELGHSSYITLRLDLPEPLVPKLKIAYLYDLIGFPINESSVIPVDELEPQPVPEDLVVDVRRIRKEGGALAIHRELSTLACRGAVPMNQGIKRTAANRLLMRVRTMLKQFPPGDCLAIDWQDTVTCQHAASRRAVTASFAPQPPALKPPSRKAARCRLAGDTKLADKHIKINLKVAGSHPRSLLLKALRCLEDRNELDARNYILEALSEQTENRFLLWIYGAQDFNKSLDLVEAAAAALRISVKGDYALGTVNAIGWAALHALYHANENYPAAYVALKRMRKSYELPIEWDKFLQRWIEAGGEEEIFWIPSVVATGNPMMIAAAFFLCLRCFAFSERLLKCVELGCATRGSRLPTLYSTYKCDLYYLRAASLILQRQYDDALAITNEGIERFGPSAKMSQMRSSCLLCARGWDGDCEAALVETDKSGAEPCPAILLRAAMGGFKSNPEVALQRAARAHQMAPSAHCAFVIARIYARMGEESLAERWAAASVKMEPYLADGWALLALLAMYQRNLHKARSSLRTAKQVGHISADIEEDLKKAKDLVQLDSLTDSLVKNVCYCDYF